MMIGQRVAASAFLAIAAVLGGCANMVDGTATWPGARLERTTLSEEDFPSGVVYDRVAEEPGAPDRQGGLPSMSSSPKACADGLTRVIAASAERGAGSAVKYVVGYDGARIVMTVLSGPLNLDGLAAEADRCARFEVFFDPSSPGIPIMTARLDTSRQDTLAYRQTMRLGGTENSVYFWFENIDTSAVFGIAFPTPNPTIAVKASLPQTFLEIADLQSDRLRLG